MSCDSDDFYNDDYDKSNNCNIKLVSTDSNIPDKPQCQGET
jgi:hypothetical protein